MGNYSNTKQFNKWPEDWSIFDQEILKVSYVFVSKIFPVPIL